MQPPEDYLNKPGLEQLNHEVVGCNIEVEVFLGINGSETDRGGSQ